MSDAVMSGSPPVDLKRRRLLTGATLILGAVGAGMGAVPFVASFQPSERARAVGAPIEVDISALEPGQMVREKWRGKPVWVVRRTDEMLANLPGLDPELRDPISEKSDQPTYAANEYRSIKPEYLVLVGLCTHLGCSPNFVPTIADAAMGADWKGGFFCPCHGSRFDLAGRVYQGVPAPKNMVVPPYRFVDDTHIVVGEDQEVA